MRKISEGSPRRFGMTTIASASAALISVLSVGCAGGPGASTGPTPLPGDTLARVGLFAFGGVGFTGTLSQGELMFRAALRQPDALDRFRILALNGTPAARMYGLAGIHVLAPGLFTSYTRSATRERSHVLVMTGCVGADEQATDVAARIERGTYDEYIRNGP